ncbi:hypothetical protein D9615_000256 [Tricholomella constricta]|uniref:AB hydrolase-1 domain-containing protein n=1 Tax=Tricholomella constricta TaxID=117010 RepID=A0A8H5HRZ4_9AGAR|nr:hypothetical protein D9615_000256 [Tricholomella constricta]
MAGEQTLKVTDGRTIAYAQDGNTSSSIVLLFFHGAFGVGEASHTSPVVAAKNIHYVAPTLPGWGNSSPVPASKPYHVALAEDTTALLNHLYPDDSTLKTLYVAGGSFGSVPAQMLYGAPFELFPLGQRIAGCLLLAPFSPFRYHSDYTRSMTLPNYISIGPPGQYIPFKLLQRTLVVGLRGKMKTQASAEKFIRGSLFDKMGESERGAFRRWSQGKGRTENEVVGNMAGNVMRSVARTWDGFMGLGDIMHSDWGFHPDALDAEHTTGRAVFIVGSAGDTMAPDAMAKWLAVTYPNAKLKLISGGHLASLLHLDVIMDEFLEGVQA